MYSSIEFTHRSLSNEAQVAQSGNTTDVNLLSPCQEFRQLQKYERAIRGSGFTKKQASRKQWSKTVEIVRVEG
jgi:hypothetical protein